MVILKQDIQTEILSKFRPTISPAICSSSFYDGDGRLIKDYPLRGCHGFMNGLTQVVRDNSRAMATSLWHKGYDYSKSKIWWDTITNEKISPWRPLLKDHQILKFKDGTYCALFINNIDGFKTSMQYLSNLLIATRAPIDNSENVNLFIRLVEDGVDQQRALLACAYFCQSLKNTHATVTQSYHWPFNPTIGISWNKLRDANPSVSPKKSFGALPNYEGPMYPNDAIWAVKANEKSFYTFFEGEKYEGPFKNYLIHRTVIHNNGDLRYGCVTYETLKEFLLGDDQFWK